MPFVIRLEDDELYWDEEAGGCSPVTRATQYNTKSVAEQVMYDLECGMDTGDMYWVVVPVASI